MYIINYVYIRIVAQKDMVWISEEWRILQRDNVWQIPNICTISHDTVTQQISNTDTTEY